MINKEPLTALRGRRLLVLNWRDVRHSEAGGAETYAHEVSRRWAAAGAQVTWLTARDAGQSRRETIDGIDVRRAGGAISVYIWAALRLLRLRGHVDAVLDCQNGIPFFAPLTVGARLPVVQLVHHVHQDQFDARFGRFAATVGRLLEGPVARHVYAGRPTVAVSVSTRQEIRRRLRFRGAIAVVPNGAPPPEVRQGRAERPTLAVVTRLVEHKRLDLLLHAVAVALPKVPDLRVDVVGGGPDLSALSRTAVELGIGADVTFHGRLPDAERDAVLGSAWLTSSTSDGEGWGCSILEAASAGIPCLARHVPGVRDSVLDGRTGWLVGPGEDLAAALVRAVTEVSDADHATWMATQCRAWARCFDWDRSAALLAGVLLKEIEVRTEGGARRTARSDIAVVARFLHNDPAAVVAGLRRTDEIVVNGNQVTALLHGCDEVGALTALYRIGVAEADVRLATRHEILAGPGLETAATPGLRAVAS